jgi:hypothetical protein
MAGKLPFPITPELTAIAIAYRNPKLIADGVLPRVPVGLQQFKYWTYPKGDAFTIPDTKVGRRSKPSEVEFGATETVAATEDFGLEDPVPQSDIDNAPPTYDPLAYATQQVTNLIELDREVRTAGLVFDANQYAATNKVALAGVNQWSDPASTPIKDIMTGLDACVFRPSIMVIGRGAFTALAQHADIIKAINRTAGDTGVATRQAIAGLFELEEILVGEGWVNTARKGQPVALARVWGKHALLLYRDRLADTRSGVTFGFTAQFQQRVAGAMEDPDIGLRGGQRVRVGESVKELIAAADLAYFIQNAAA